MRTTPRATDPEVEITKRVVEAIVNSPLNIEFIPDDIEKLIYEAIITVARKSKKKTSLCYSSCFSGNQVDYHNTE